MTDSEPAPWEYVPAPESAGLAGLSSEYRLFVDGTFSAGSGEKTTSVNPATTEELATVAGTADSDVDRAVEAASGAFRDRWGGLDGSARAKYLFRLARLLQERGRELAVLESLDTGKPVRQAREFDLPNAAAYFLHHAGWADKLDYAGFGPDPAPFGVVGQVLPWNFPLLTLAQQVAPALACGNTVVVKPAETTPLSALVFAELCQQAGLPPGVVNVLTGGAHTGEKLLSHPGVAKPAFVGSTEVGRRIRHRLAGTGRTPVLMLGGSGTNIVFADAPVEQAVQGVVDGAFFNQGHVRGAGSRVLVEESVAEEFVERVRERTATLRVGDPLDRNTDVGAVNSAAELDRITRLVETGEAEGARRWSSPHPLPERGYFLAPTVFSEVHQSMRLAREEVFGPVLSVLTFRTPEEAVTKANNTPHGLAAGVWSEKGSRTLWTANRLRTGVVWGNTFHRFDPTAPFGGERESGSDRVGGRAGLEAYLDV
ncbi:aldehyde dehydrogenase family protein [Actinopolyspora mortivallis]|uniref:Betaine-aldehyde dehydrogenase n=1 Tax=Actinopolyspora mortivallis TaxID=33906 RepID=A0A2T0GXD9_ACTMO|nr:aldehyde dehydrogenase family protein [Actinopolyspora mortivallis]PRW63785.1 betaine-aldehyde dehydrogenase [Actinopolyspora mortivallis]